MSFEPLGWALERAPAGWGRAPLKALALVNPEALPEDTNAEFRFAYVDIGSVSRGSVQTTQELSFGEAPSRARRVVRPGDILVSTVRTYLRAVAPVPTSETPLVASTGFAVLRPNGRMSPEYMRYWLTSTPFIEQIVAQSVGVSYPAINASDIARTPVLVPPADMQMRIVEQLDTAMRRLQELADVQTSMASALVERRRSLVFEAVTGARKPGDRREGPPWAPSIPGSWQRRRLLSLARLGSGHTPSRSRPELWAEPTVPWITTGEVHQVRSDRQETISQTRECLDLKGIAESAATIHPAGTVVLCRTAASAGYSALMASDMATSQDFATWTCGPDLLPDYLLYCLRAMRPDLLGRLAMGSTHKTIYMPEIRSLQIPLPPYQEQVRLVERLREQLAAVDAMLDEIPVQLTLLEERRQSLITSAITGHLEFLA